MEQELIVAEILRNKPHGIKLYSPIFGACTFCYIKDESSDICVRRPYNEMSYFNFDGVYHSGGERLLFPSNEMRDWSKFAWKKGDVLVNENNAHIIFEKFSNDTYTTFIGKYYFDSDESGHSYIYGRCTACTQQFHIEGGDAVQTYISNVEKEIGGKLNLKTLEVEKEQPEFKDGDILSCDEDTYTKHTTLILHKNGCVVESLVSLIRHHDLVESREPINEVLLSRLYYAREDEKKELFDALANEGKAWDAGKKMIIDLRPKVEFKPFDKVLCRNSKDDTWEADFFARLTRKEIDYTQSGKYLCVGDLWMYCIPYNEETAHLLGTTDEWKGGEG